MNGPSEEVRELDRSRAELEDDLRRFPLTVTLAQRRLFWRHLTLNVRSATPLLAAAATHDGIDVQTLVRRIAPPLSWPRRALPTDPGLPQPGQGRERAFGLSQFLRRHRIVGAYLHVGTTWSDLFGLRIRSSVVEVTALLGDLRIETFGGIARLRLEGQLPEIVATTAIGRPIGEIVQHSWLDGAPWPIVSVDVGLNYTDVTFETGLVDWRLASPVLK